MASTPPTEEAFLREVDEELRQEQMLSMWKRYGRIALVAVVVLLVALAAWLFWRAEAQKKREAQGETMGALIADVQANRKAEATKKIDQLVAEGSPGYRLSALFTRAALAIDGGDKKAAAAIYAGIARDEDAPQPYRDVALIRQTLIEYDDLQPQQVIDRLRPLTTPDNAFFGTAGELSAIAMLQSGRAAEAGRLLAEVARNKQTPDSLRARAARLATSLGVNVDAKPAPAPAAKD
ncbi:tetratricopeptide repeat protein [Sphingomonadaceae bacterium G21617-S1]|uniref:tetratricopeptide repeat protein n=1 Tax=Rhizorhabdus sp. TaxID=1968843 RepID=UPI00014D79C0|nr:tetratricopeptide repeat protein [Rhizorhabdus sp.]MBD3762153.1 tetratricopeptide repeat protein [Rhizorhabdus sp.]MCZ4340242.1 tetratricopeptide repeat protein [Sphingomonadaceae bacterium G21617-S1]